MVVSLGLFYGCFIGSSMITMVATTVICLFLLFCKNDVLLPSMLYFSSFAYMFQANSLMLYEFPCIIFMCRVFVKEKRKQSFLLFWFVIYFITHIISSGVTLTNIIPIIYILIILISCISYKKELYDSCVKMFLLGVFISSLLGLLKPFSPHLIELLAEDFAEGMSIDFVIRFSGLSYDPNFYTIGVIISIMILLFSEYQKTWLILFLAVVYSCFGAITYSKSYILSLCIVFLLYFLDGKTNMSKKILLFAVLGCLLSASFLDEIIYVFKGRFNGVSDINSLTTGRNELWGLYLSHIGDTLTTLLFGHGLNSIVGEKVAHNTYIQMLYNFGIIGCIVDFLYIKKCYRLLNRTGLSMVSVGIIFVIIMLLFNLSAYTFPSLWGCLTMIFILISKRSMNYVVNS